MALTIAVLAASLIAADRLITLGLDALYAHSGASPVAVLNAANADTVVVGTSTGKSGIHPASWPGKLVNLAEDGQTVLYSIAGARAFADVDSVRRIIIAIDPGDLRYGLDNPSAKRIWRIAPLIAAIPEIAPLLAETRPVTEAPFFLTSWRYRGEVGEIVSKFGKTRPKPYRPLPQGALVEPVPEAASELEGAKVHASLERYLGVLDEVARRPGKEIVLTITPIYRDRYSDRPSQAAVLADFRRRLAGIPVCDLMEVDTPALATLRADAANFHDNVHHTEAGGKAFTAELARLVAETCRK